MHFTTLVQIDGSVKEADLIEAVHKALKPFNETESVTPYLDKTRQQLIEGKRREMIDYRDNGLYAKYVADPEAYINSTNNFSHLRYMGVSEDIIQDKISKVFPDLASWEKRDLEPSNDDYLSFPERVARIDDDEFVHGLETSWYDTYSTVDEARADDAYEWIDPEGNRWTIRNPQGHWDWYEIGGRWDGQLNNTAGRKAEKYNGSNHLRIRDLRRPESTYSYVTKDGEWVSKEVWNGWDFDSLTQEVWDKKMAEWLLSAPGEDWIVLVDYHS